MHISRTNTVVLCSVVFCVKFVTGQNTSLTSPREPPAAVDCGVLGVTQLNSAQFAKLCRIKGFLNRLDITEMRLPAEFIGKTADFVCDGDCQCVMGALGGRCGLKEGDNSGKLYCLCDYNNRVNSSQLNALLNPLVCPVFSAITPPLCELDLFQQACNSDCQCSHGYGNTGNHVCKPFRNGTYCVCENGENINQG